MDEQKAVSEFTGLPLAEDEAIRLQMCDFVEMHLQQFYGGNPVSGILIVTVQAEYKTAILTNEGAPNLENGAKTLEVIGSFLGVWASERGILEYANANRQAYLFHALVTFFKAYEEILKAVSEAILTDPDVSPIEILRKRYKTPPRHKTSHHRQH